MSVVRRRSVRAGWWLGRGRTAWLALLPALLLVGDASGQEELVCERHYHRQWCGYCSEVPEPYTATCGGASSQVRHWLGAVYRCSDGSVVAGPACVSYGCPACNDSSDTDDGQDVCGSIYYAPPNSNSPLPELCGDGQDHNYDGCAGETCTLGYQDPGHEECTCEGACNPAPTACLPKDERPKASCSPRSPNARVVCGRGRDDQCSGLIGTGCAPCKGDGCCENKAGTDPILLSSRSAVTEGFADFSVDTGLGELGITRTYSSADWSYSDGPVGPFGRGWHHQWEGWVSCKKSTCTVVLGLDPGYRFEASAYARSLDGSETWVVLPPWTNEVMKGDNQNLLVQRPGGEFIMFSPDGRELHFENVCDACAGSSGDPYCQSAVSGGKARLTRVVDSRGNSVRLAYDRPGGVVLGLTDDLGHELQVRSTSACSTGLASSLVYDGMTVAQYQYAGADLLGATDADGSVLRTYAYDPASGLLLAVQNEAGDEIASFSYDEELRADGIIDRYSSVAVQYGDSSTVQVTEHYSGTSSTSTRRLDGDGKVVSISEGCACGPARALHWTDRRLVCESDVAGRVTWQDFDARGRVTHRLEYGSSQGCPTSAPTSLDPTKAREEWRTYGLERAIAEKVALPLDRVLSRSRRSTLSSSGKYEESVSYDPAPQSIDPSGYACQASPLPAGSVPCRVIQTGYTQNPPGTGVSERHAFFFSYDARGRLIETRGPVNLDHPADGEVVPREVRTYWPDTDSLVRRGRLHEVKRFPSAEGAPLVVAYDSDSLGILSVTEPGGGVTTIVKDGRGRPIGAIGPDGSVRQRRYHDGLDPRIDILPTGGAVRSTYDSRGRLSGVELLSSDPEAVGAAPTLAWGEYYSYDEAGNQVHTERRDSSGAVTWQQDRSYDVRHRVVSETNPEAPARPAALAYDAAGFLTSVTDEEGRAISITRDPLGRVSAVTRSGLDPSGNPVSLGVGRYTYDKYVDAVVKVTDAKAGNTGYQYDDFGRLLSISSLALPGSTQGQSRDARGNLLQQAMSAWTIRYAYDGLDRPISASASNNSSGYSSTHTYVYDEAPFPGRLTRVVEPDRTSIFTYDAAGRLASESINENGVSSPLVTSYAYYLDGTVSDVTYPSGLHVRLERDPATREVVRVVNVGDGTVYAGGITRLPGGPVASLVFGNALTLSGSFDLRHQPEAVSSGPVSLGYAITPAGDIGSVTSGAVTRQYTHDFLDRLTGSPGWLSYSYDDDGNRTAETVEGTAASYTYWGTRPDFLSTRVSGGSTLTFSVDAQSNLTLFKLTGPKTCLVHDAWSRLVAAGQSTTSCLNESKLKAGYARFKYDAWNRRIARQPAGSTQWTYVIHDRAGHPLSEVALVNGSWVNVRDYVWLGGLPLAQIEYPGPAGIGSGYVYYVHADHLGMPRALTNQAGQTVWSAVVRPYGDIVESTSVDPLSGRTVVTNLRLPGQYDERLLGSLGLQGPYYNWNRWYLPGVGRYLEPDPIALGGGFNGEFGLDWYGYGNGSPLRWVDSTGLFGFQVVWTETTDIDWGLFAGGQSGAFGAGYLGSGILDLHKFVSVSWGGFAEVWGHKTWYPRSDGADCLKRQPWALGAFGGGGVGLVFTNAETESDLRGPFRSTNVNAGWNVKVWGLQHSTGTNAQGREISVWTYSGPPLLGRGFGAAMSAYNTNTWITRVPSWVPFIP